MLDKQTASFLKVINNLCSEGGYKVLELSDLLERLPAKYKFNEDSINQCIDYLADRNYIDVKYRENQMYCISALPKSRMYFENQIEQDKQNKSYRKLFYLSIIVSGLTSFFGAILGIILLK